MNSKQKTVESRSRGRRDVGRFKKRWRIFEAGTGYQPKLRSEEKE